MDAEKFESLKTFLHENALRIKATGIEIVRGKFGDGEFTAYAGAYICRKRACILSALLVNKCFEFSYEFSIYLDPIKTFVQKWEFAVQQELKKSGFELEYSQIWEIVSGFDETIILSSATDIQFVVLGKELAEILFGES